MCPFLWVHFRCTIEDDGGDVGGASTKNPFLLVNEADGTGKILFLNGMSDWEITGDTTAVNYSQMSVDQDGKVFIKIEAAEGDTTAENEAATDTETAENNGASDTEEDRGKIASVNPVESEKAVGAQKSEKKAEKVKLTISSEKEKTKEIIEVSLDAERNVTLKSGK